jgi:transposase
MERKKEQYDKIKDCFPKQRKPAKISNQDVLNAVLYVMENRCKWRGLPKEYGSWHVICVWVNRWAKKGVLQAAFLCLQQLGIIQIKVNMVSLDSICIKVHPDGMGALKKEVLSPSGEHGAAGISNFIWSPHLIEMG